MVVNAVPSNVTTDVFTNPVPIIVIRNDPVPMVVGLTELITGNGFCKFTAPLPDLVVS